MSFFKDFKDDLSQAVNELMPEEAAPSAAPQMVDTISESAAPIGQDDLAELIKEIAVYELHQVCTVLVGMVNAALDGQCFHGINLGITDNILQMPLNCVNPILEIEIVLYAFLLVRILYRSVYIVCLVIVSDGTLKYPKTFLAECHVNKLF